ncbi:MAG: hypothetical protein HZA54_17340 [Planctomycetes bacterium]|nr:hypothetical protein [Planctomycetota bacterium]
MALNPPMTDQAASWTYLSGVPWSPVKTHTIPGGRATTYFWDLEDAALGDLNGDGLVNQTGGNLVKIAHPLVTLGVTTPLPAEEKFWYDGAGWRTRAIDPEGRATRFDYFAAGPSAGYLGRLIVNPGGLNLTTSYTKDGVGNLTSTTSPRGVTAF